MPLKLRKVAWLLAIALLLTAGGSFVVWQLFKPADRSSLQLLKQIEWLWAGDQPLQDAGTPREILRHLEKRVYGHTRIETVFLPILHAAQRSIERPVPQIALPTLGKGQQTAAPKAIPGQAASHFVDSPEKLRQAFGAAQSGQVIELLPGRYAITGKLQTPRGGTLVLPIVVRAASPGSVVLEVSSEVGFHVTQPNWIFENLLIRGVCKEPGNCEHAFHVTGNARGTRIRNNRIEDFNAHIKVNGVGADWPDAGVVEFNTLINTRPRETRLPVTPFDLVGANDWIVADNLISNFVKGDGDKVSYGVFMKGGGRQGRIERNLVICTPEWISQPGVRVGISFGGGGTGQGYCRGGACKAEHYSGIASNNIVAHCNDTGIDVFRSSQITLAHNTLINTGGIDVREAPASARLYGNHLEGYVRTRKGGQIKLEMNETAGLSAAFRNLDGLDLAWVKMPEKIPSLAGVATDFCRRPRPDGTLPGALGEAGVCQETVQSTGSR